ncbi:MAG: chloride channel protein [Alistipes putredinis]|nr:MAG: chloride channel protein [Alistipes putredinis]
MGSNIGRLLKLDYKQMTLLLCCGAGAALAAIFKAPIAGVIFVFEILMFDITAGSVVPLLIATVSATTLSFFLRGFDPILAVTVPDAFRFQNLPMYALLGVLCGLMSYYFTTVNSRVSAFFGGKSMYMKWLIAGVVLGVLIFIFPPLYGEGYSSFTDLMNGRIEPLFDNSLFYDYRNITWVVILYLLATPFLKVVAMAATNAAGGVGGTFAPSLFVGAYIGVIVAYTGNTFLGMNLPLISFALVGMAGVMSGVMKAPLTSIFLIAELSNGYGLFVPLMLVSSISFALDYYLDPDSIYTKQLRQRGELLTHNKDQSVLVFLNLDKLMETDFVPLSVSATLGDLVKIIKTARRNIFPVLDAGGELLGVVQLDDLREDMFNVQKYGTKITEYMIPPPDKILSNQHMQSVLDSFEEAGTWMLPVVDKNNRYLGFISKSRILAAYRQQLVDISQ